MRLSIRSHVESCWSIGRYRLQDTLDTATLTEDTDKLTYAESGPSSFA